jgi:hypothetical protein
MKDPKLPRQWLKQSLAATPKSFAALQEPPASVSKQVSGRKGRTKRRAIV